MSDKKQKQSSSSSSSSEQQSTLNQQIPRSKISPIQNNKLKNIRAVNFCKKLVFDVPGCVSQNSLAIGDVDNDGDNELVVGTIQGDLFIFKGTKLWQKKSGLGMITGIAIGDIFNYGRNALVVICGDGWINIFYSPRLVNSKTSNTKDPVEKIGKHFDEFKISEFDKLSCKMERVHLQRIPPNTKVVLIADIDHDGSNELIIALTDRVVRSYRWICNDGVGSGTLIGLNKWESAGQIGGVGLQHTCDGIPTLLVAQPGGTFMRIKCNIDDSKPQDDSETKHETTSCVDYQTLGISRARNPNISTQILGNLEPEIINYHDSDDTPSIFVPKQLSTKNNINDTTLPLSMNKESSLFYQNKLNLSDIDQVDGNMIGGNIILGEIDVKKNNKILPTYEDFSKKNHQIIETSNNNNDNLKINEEKIVKKKVENSKPYALATLDGTIILVRDEIILWAMQVDHQIFALGRLDVTGNGSDDIVASAWDGQTYILDQSRNCVRFQVEEPVAAFCTGNYSVLSGTKTPSLVYHTFSNKIYIFHDIVLPSLTIKSLSFMDCLNDENRVFVDKIVENLTGTERATKIKKLTNYLLYEMDSEDDDIEIDDNIFL